MLTRSEPSHTQRFPGAPPRSHADEAIPPPIDLSLIDAMERGDVRAYSTQHTRCAARFIAYTDNFIGNDGRSKRCKL